MLRQAALAGLLLALLPSAAWPASAKPAGTLGKIAARKEIRMGYRTDVPPFSFVDESKQPAGYSIDLCNAIAARVAVTLQDPTIDRKFIPVTAENRLDAIQKGRIDIECGVTSVTLSRREQVDFTNVVFITGGSLVLRKGHEVESLADLKRKRIAVIRGSTTEGVLSDLLTKAGITPDLLQLGSMDEALMALGDRKADAIAEDRFVLIGAVQAKKLQDTVSLPPFLYSYEPYAFPVRRDDASFRLVADEALADLFRSGKIWDVYDHWIGALGAKPSEALAKVFALQAVPN